MNKQLIRELGLDSDYDYNIWSDEPNKLTLTAYELEFVHGVDPANIQTNSSKYHSITFTAPEDTAEIEYLLDDMYINHYPLTDYDEWTDLGTLTRDKVPARIGKFLFELPQYTPAINEWDREAKIWKRRLLEI
jgi:hypothetical protein